MRTTKAKPKASRRKAFQPFVISSAWMKNNACRRGYECFMKAAGGRSIRIDGPTDVARFVKKYLAVERFTKDGKLVYPLEGDIAWVVNVVTKEGVSEWGEGIRPSKSYTEKGLANWAARVSRKYDAKI